jgi:hypothetical protein
MSCPACRTTYKAQPSRTPKGPEGQGRGKAEQSGREGAKGESGRQGKAATGRGKEACCGANGADGNNP